MTISVPFVHPVIRLGTGATPEEEEVIYTEPYRFTTSHVFLLVLKLHTGLVNSILCYRPCVYS
jgi:hypothetical protein